MQTTFTLKADMGTDDCPDREALADLLRAVADTLAGTETAGPLPHTVGHGWRWAFEA